MVLEATCDKFATLVTLLSPTFVMSPCAVILSRSFSSL